MNGAAEFSEVFLTDAVVHADDVIGAPGDGWTVARTTLRHERASTAGGPGRGAVVAEAGEADGNLDRRVGDLVGPGTPPGGAPKRQPALLGSRAMIELARAHGRLDRPALRDRLLRFHVHAEVYRLNGRRARDLARAKQPTALDGSALKLDLATLAHESRDLSLAILGPAGTLVDDAAPDGGRVARTALSSFVPSLGGGTNEIQRNILGERALGLPREPSDDAEVPFRELRRSTTRSRGAEETT